jgi:dTDP-4-amino-4,6-dideoxygalactose transaminase
MNNQNTILIKIPFSRPWVSVSDRNIVLKALQNQWLTNGPYKKKFESNFSKYLNTKYSTAVSSGTSALHLALKAIGITNNDEVILPTFTFVATDAVVNYCNAKSVLVDVDIDSFNISPNEILKKITNKTKAIIVVHYGGQSCDMDQICKIAKKFDLSIIEDCAHSLGAKFENKMCGTLGDVSCFSFYPSKTITTGEGGMISTKHQKVSEKIKLLSSHGINISINEREKNATWNYDVEEIGYNYRLDELSSALGYSQLKKISTIIKKQRKIAEEYTKSLKNIKGIITPKIKYTRDHVFHLYTIRVTEEFQLTRDELFKKLHKRGIRSSVQYTPLHLMTYNKKKYQKTIDNFPNANLLKEQVISLPIFPQMTRKEIEYILETFY